MKKLSFSFFIILSISSFVLTGIIFSTNFTEPDVSNVLGFFIFNYIRFLIFLISVFINVLIVSIFDKKFYKAVLEDFFTDRGMIFMNSKVFTLFIYIFSMPFAFSLLVTLLYVIF